LYKLDKLTFIVNITTMKIAVIGCGGIGGVVAGVICEKKYNLYCITGKEKSAEIINNNGLHIHGKKGKIDVKAKAFSGLKEDMGKFDIIILTVKNNVVWDVFLKSKDFLSDNGFILTLQNGIEVIRIADEFSDVNIIAGAVGYNSIMLDYGEYFVTSNGGITVGSISGNSSTCPMVLKDIFEPKISVDISKNIISTLWTKLAIVCGVTGLGGVSGLLTGKLLKNSVARRLFYAIVTEVVDIAKGKGIEMEKFGGAINPKRFCTGGNGYPIFIKYLLLKIVGLKFKSLKSNIHHSLEKGKKTEVDYINGAVVKIGEKLGIDAKVNKEIVKIVKEIENNKMNMSIQNLYKIWAKINYS